jgi:hypothetical protein
VYSSYKHIINNAIDNLRYFKEPIFIWTNLPDEQATVIITYLCGGILPISGLLLTSMVTNYLDEQAPKAEKAEGVQETASVQESLNNSETLNSADDSPIDSDAMKEKNPMKTHMIG